MQPKKNRKKPVPNLKFAVAFGFFSVFSVFFGFFRFFVVLFRFFSVCTSTRNSSHSKIMSKMRSREAKNCLITHFMPIKPCKCFIKAIITNKSHLTRTRLTSQNWPKWKNRKKNRKKPKKNRKKPVPNLKFAVAFGFFGLQPPLLKVFLLTSFVIFLLFLYLFCIFSFLFYFSSFLFCIFCRVSRHPEAGLPVVQFQK